jgi:hypothetical protein
MLLGRRRAVERTLAEDGRRPRVIAGQLDQLAIAGQIHPAVADVRDRHRAVGHQRRHDRRAHAGVVVVVLGFAEYSPIREVHGGPKPVRVERQVRIDAVRPGVLLVLAGPSNKARHGFHGEPGRHLTGGVPSHPVGDDQQAQRLVFEQRIFIRAPDWTSIGASSGTQRRQR